jgi:hypothetical protein
VHGAASLRRTTRDRAGILCSFLDRSKWGDFDARLDARSAKRFAREMLEYDAQGLDVWIGEDFDARVMAVLRAHRTLTTVGVRAPTFPPVAGVLWRISFSCTAHDRGAMPQVRSIIVEAPHDVRRNMRALLRDLNTSSLEWVQLGPPALEYLDEYAQMQAAGWVQHYGVEDYTA